ncbi:MAG: hypothetical protein ABH863_03090 [Candidatus Micrarchaeota archaeon]
MRNNIRIAVAACVLIALIFGLGAPFRIEGTAGEIAKNTQDPESLTTIAIPAIDGNGMGTLAEIRVSISDGSGKMAIKANRGTLAISPETLESVRNAFDAANRYSGNRFAAKDVQYEFGSTLGVISGGSGGAAIAIATIAGLEGNRIVPGILITGSMDKEGKIERVGFILEKAAALNGTEYGTLLVPIGESVYPALPKTCYLPGGGKDPNCKPPTIIYNVSKETGIEIIEVENIGEAARLMLIDE